MTVREKINLIDSLADIEEPDSIHFEILRTNITDQNNFVRSRCAYMLRKFRNEESLCLLVALCSDADAFVRTEAYDTLSFFPCKRVERLLYMAVSNDSAEQSRCYAILSWCDVIHSMHRNYDGDIQFLTDILRTEKSERCRLYCYCGMYRLGYAEVLPEILGFIKSENYTVRCSVANQLSEMARREDKDMIMTAVDGCLRAEETMAVKSSMQKLVSVLSGI